MLDHFQMGPNLVRGFAPAGIGPRDLTAGTNQDPLGGTMFWGASVEAQAPFQGIHGQGFAARGAGNEVMKVSVGVCRPDPLNQHNRHFPLMDSP